MCRFGLVIAILFRYPSRKTVLANHCLVRILEAYQPRHFKSFQILFLQKFGDYLYTDCKQFGFLRKAWVAIMQSILFDVL